MRIGVLDTSYGDIEVEREAAKPFGVEVVDLRSEPGQVDGVLVQYANVSSKEIEENPSWKVIGRYGVGVDTIDIPEASSRGIAVVNVPDYCEEEVACHAMALILSALRELQPADQMVRDGKWEKWVELRPMIAPSVLTLALIGTGRIGMEVIRMARPFFGKIIAHDPWVTSIDGVQLVSLDDALTQGDVISLHCPLNADTHHIIDAGAIEKMKKNAILVNVSRGGLIDANVLANALACGKISGAALDVLETEPPVNDPLLSAPRTILTNHLAWYSEQSEQKLRRELAGRCAQYLTGKQVSSVVNADDLK